MTVKELAIALFRLPDHYHDCPIEFLCPDGYAADINTCHMLINPGHAFASPGVTIQLSDKEMTEHVNMFTNTLQKLNESLIARIAAQSELLTKKAERKDATTHTIIPNAN